MTSPPQRCGRFGELTGTQRLPQREVTQRVNQMGRKNIRRRTELTVLQTPAQ